MAKFRVRVDRGAIVAADPWSQETINGLATDKDFWIEITNTRKLGTLADWWAGLSYMVMRWEGYNDPRAKLYPTARKLNDAVLVKLGFTETWYHLDGSVQIRADSIRFEAITDEDEFKAILEMARVMALDLWGIDPWDEWKEAKARAGGARDWRKNWRPGDED
jgi:hypothetical protein